MEVLSRPFTPVSGNNGMVEYEFRIGKLEAWGSDKDGNADTGAEDAQEGSGQYIAGIVNAVIDP